MKKSFISPVRCALAFLLIAGALAACTYGTYDEAAARFYAGQPQPPPQPPGGFGANFSEIQANVFTPSCARSGCHEGANPDGNLNLEAANSYAMLVGIASDQDPATQRVNPGSPNLSYLIQKLEGPGVTGQQMPPNATLAQADIDVIRQWITDGAIDDRAPASDPIRVASLSPMPGAPFTVAPSQIVAGFDRAPDPATVNDLTFTLEGSGGDGAFGQANDVPITATSISMAGGNPMTAVFDLTGVALADDTYRVRLLGDGANVILDMDGNRLDGEYLGAFPSGDAAEGGDFESQFTLSTPVVIQPTMDDIQANVFTPSCASCHSGAMPAGSLDLSDADTSHMQLVGVNSVGQPAIVLVVPMDPTNSYLIQKLEGAPGIAGRQMPPGPPLPQSTINVIRQWITNGAAR